MADVQPTHALPATAHINPIPYPADILSRQGLNVVLFQFIIGALCKKFGFEGVINISTEDFTDIIPNAVTIQEDGPAFIMTIRDEKTFASDQARFYREKADILDARVQELTVIEDPALV